MTNSNLIVFRLILTTTITMQNNSQELVKLKLQTTNLRRTGVNELHRWPWQGPDDLAPGIGLTVFG